MLANIAMFDARVVECLTLSARFAVMRYSVSAQNKQITAATTQPKHANVRNACMRTRKASRGIEESAEMTSERP